MFLRVQLLQKIDAAKQVWVIIPSDFHISLILAARLGLADHRRSNLARISGSSFNQLAIAPVSKCLESGLRHTAPNSYKSAG